MVPVEKRPAFMNLHPDHWQQMKNHVSQQNPLEACGIVGGIDHTSLEVFPITNMLQRPDRFRMEPTEQLQTLLLLEERGWDLLAIYHSHPSGPPIPSETDLAESAYPEAVNLIWSKVNGEWDCRGFIISENQVHEIGLIMVRNE